jgi:PAS domain S-box-containing protein
MGSTAIWRVRPIKQKLMIMTMVTTTTALLAAGVGTVVTDWVLFRGYLRRDLTALARIVADNCTASLAFNDSDSAGQTLATLHARTHVRGACVYRTDASVLAQYSPDAGFACPAPEHEVIVRFSTPGLQLWRPVMLSGRRVGTLGLFYDLGEVRDRIGLYATAVVGVVLAAGMFAFLLWSRLQEAVAKPFSKLVQAATLVSETGNYSIRATKMSEDELGVLVDRFNEMLAGIESREGELKRAFRAVEDERERFRFMAESMPQKIWTSQPDGGAEYFNQQWTEFTGAPVEQMRGWRWTEFVHPDDLKSNLSLWRDCVSTGEPYHVEHRFRRADGRYRWHLSRARAMRDEQGQIRMWIGSSTEIHEQKEKEEELRRANDDLQQFAYSASHDLQEPIRNVAVYSEIVATRYKQALDADGRVFLGFLQEGGHRLAKLVDDLLAYTRASRADIVETRVDAEAVLGRVLAGLSETIRENQAVITNDPLPQVYMGDAHLQQVFQNLISNALKYRTEDPPRIHVSAVEQDSAWCFSVKDNGIGIDPAYKEKIFGVFKRLHHDEKYSGTGIGLAICQRVVERYGGRIWVESEAGKGATLRFTIPRRRGNPRDETVSTSGG